MDTTNLREMPTLRVLRVAGLGRDVTGWIEDPVMRDLVQQMRGAVLEAANSGRFEGDDEDPEDVALELAEELIPTSRAEQARLYGLLPSVGSVRLDTIRYRAPDDVADVVKLALAEALRMAVLRLVNWTIERQPVAV